MKRPKPPRASLHNHKESEIKRTHAHATDRFWVLAQPQRVGNTSQGGHWHGDEWHAALHAAHSNSAMPTQSDTSDPAKLHRERSLQERQRLLQEKAALEEELAKIKAEQAEFAAAKAAFEELKAGMDRFSDITGITREKFSSMSDSEKSEFFKRVNEFEAFRLEISPKILALPEWILDELERKIPGALTALSLPPKDGVLWHLQAERLGVPHLGGVN